MGLGTKDIDSVGNFGDKDVIELEGEVFEVILEDAEEVLVVRKKWEDVVDTVEDIELVG